MRRFRFVHDLAAIFTDAAILLVICAGGAGVVLALAALLHP